MSSHLKFMDLAEPAKMEQNFHSSKLVHLRVSLDAEENNVL